MISMSHRLNSMFCPNCFVCALLRFLTLRGSSLMRRLQSRRSPLHVAAICLLSALAVGGCLEGCERRPSPSTAAQAFSRPASVPSSAIRFDSVARQAGIDFAPSRGGRSPLTILETAGGGCAFLDYDGDGWPDILLVAPHKLALYHNLHNGKFANVTAGSGIATNRYWMGCAVGDYDGDGLPDIFLTGYHCYALYHNLGGGRFKDVTRESGISGLDWSLSAAFADFNGDGRLDLFVSQYLRFDATTQQICQVGAVRSACGPEIYQALSGKLFLNVGGASGKAKQSGNGKMAAPMFRSVPWKDTGKTWGALASDLLGQGRPALYLANDMMPGDLWLRQGNIWQDRGTEMGTAYDGQGHMQGGMGVDSGDYDNDGHLDLIVTTYFAQSISLYHNDGDGLFTYASSTTGLSAPTTPYVKFGVGFVDLDNDGWLDLVVTSGHVRDNVHDFDASQTYAQPIQVFHNQGGHFTEVTAQAGGINQEPVVGRGIAFADYNQDGREDVLICNLEGNAVLLANRSKGGHWLNVQLSAEGGNRFGLGARVTLTAAGHSQLREVRTSGIALSAYYPVAHFGLGNLSGPVKLSIRWPDEGRSTAITTEIEVKNVDATVNISREHGLVP